MKPKAKASQSTYLDIGLVHIGRLEMLVVLLMIDAGRMSYQAADHDLTFGRDGVSILDSLSSRLNTLCGLLDSSNRNSGVGSLGSGVAATVAHALAAVDEDLVERLIELSRHV
jgi:hypothetical protein